MIWNTGIRVVLGRVKPSKWRNFKRAQLLSSWISCQDPTRIPGCSCRDSFQDHARSWKIMHDSWRKIQQSRNPSMKSRIFQDSWLEMQDFPRSQKLGIQYFYFKIFRFRCGHCKNLAPEWKKVAKALDGIVKIGAVDADQHRDLGGRYQIQGFPTIKVFGSNKNSPTDYQGGRTANAITDYAMSELKKIVSSRLGGGGGRSSGGSSGGGDSKDVITLTDSNFDQLVMQSEDMWLVEFFAPWCGHCKRLAPEWASAASQLKGKVKLGAVDATTETSLAGRWVIVQLFINIIMKSSRNYREKMKGQTKQLLWAGNSFSYDMLFSTFMRFRVC